MPGNWNVDVATVRSGKPFVATVTDAPCESATVKFYLNAALVAMQTVTVPGSATFNCPPNTGGQTWTVEFSCSGGNSVQRQDFVV